MESAGTHERFPQTQLTDEQAAVLIRVLLRAEGEVPLVGLAEELGLSDHQFGMGLGLLIRDAKAKIRQGPEGLVVYAPREAEATGPVAPIVVGENGTGKPRATRDDHGGHPGSREAGDRASGPGP